MARAFKDMPEDQREEIMRRLSGPARGATMDALHESEANAREAAAQKAEEIAKEIYVQRGGYIGSHGSPERFKGLMADIPLDQREAVLAAIPEEQREDAEAAMAMVVSDEALVQTSVALAETATIGGKPNPDVAKAVLDVVPLEQREAALAKMSEGARAAVEAEAAKRTAELEAASSALFKAVDDGDPNAMRKLLLNRGPQEIAELERIYGEQNLDENGKPRSLRGDLKEEFAEDIDEEAGERNDRDYIEAVFDGDKTTAKAIALQLAMEGTGSTDSTDEELIFATLESIKDPEERARVEAIFEERQSLDEDAVEDGTNTLTGMLRDELLEEDDASEAERDDYDYNRAMALHAGNFEKASAVKADQMLDPGIMGDLSIRDAMKGAMIVPGVGMAVAWAGPEVLELAGVDVDQKVAQPNVEGVAEMMADKPQAERDKIDAEMQGITGGAGLADVAAARCQNDYDVDLVDSAVKGDEVGVKAARWKKRAAGVNADEQGMMQQIEGPDHAKVMARIDEKYGEGTFNRLSNDVMNEEELKANQQLAETGEVDPVTGISAAAGRHALSWSLDDIGKHLRIKNGEHKGELHSADKMTEIKGELCAQWEVTEEELEEMIDEKMGGKDAFKLKQMLKGEPKDFHERMQRLRDEHDFTRGSGAGVIGSTVTDLSSDAGAAQDSQMAKLEGLYGTLADLDAKKADGGELTAEEQASYDKTMKEFTERSRYFGSNVSNYQAAQESITNDVTMVVGAVTAATVTIASAGTLGPAAAGVMGTLYAGAATMLTKEAMLGDSYNTHDQGKDAVNTAAQMGAGLATAGLAPAIGNAAGSVGGAVGNTLGATAGQVASAGFTGVANGAVSGLIAAPPPSSPTRACSRARATSERSPATSLSAPPARRWAAGSPGRRQWG
jgi:hypothetical protein